MLLKKKKKDKKLSLSLAIDQKKPDTSVKKLGSAEEQGGE